MIYYFSGTGNTRWLANTLAAALHTEAVDICTSGIDGFAFSELRLPDDPDEPIGFAFPIHGWQPPMIMRRFVRSLPASILDQRYVFAVCTCGDETGEALNVFARELHHQGLKLAMCASVQMPNTYVCLPFMDTDPKEVEARKLDEARLLVPQLAERINRRVTGEYLTKGTAPWLLTHVIGEYFNRHMVGDRKFRVDADRCVHCGRCAEACPTGNIIISSDNGTPEWRHDGSCTGCLACYHVCPRHAIGYGSITARRGQYYNSSK